MSFGTFRRARISGTRKARIYGTDKSQDRYKLKARKHQAHAPSIKDKLKVYPRNFLRTIAAIPSIPLPNITRLLGSGEGSPMDVPLTAKAVSPYGVSVWKPFVLSCCHQPGSPLPAAPAREDSTICILLEKLFWNPTYQWPDETGMLRLVTENNIKPFP